MRPPYTQSMIMFTEKARLKILEFIRAQGKEGTALRVSISAKDAAGFKYNFQLEDYGTEKPTDTILREGGFATRIDPESGQYLKGATVDWTEKDGKVGFSVENPNKPAAPGTPEEMHASIMTAIQSVYDPEIPAVNIHDLGLIYKVDISAEKIVTVRMTLTAPNCPAAEQLPAEVQTKVGAIPGVKEAKIDLVFEPPWDKDMMSDAAKLELNLL